MEMLTEKPSGQISRPAQLRLEHARPQLVTQLSEPYSSSGTKSPSVFSFGCVFPTITTPANSNSAMKLYRTDSARRKAAQNLVLNGTEPCSVSYVKQKSLLPNQGSSTQLYRASAATASNSTSSAQTPSQLAASCALRLQMPVESASISNFNLPPATESAKCESEEKESDMPGYSSQRRTSLLTTLNNGAHDEQQHGAGVDGGRLVARNDRTHANNYYDGMAAPGATVHYTAPPTQQLLSPSIISPTKTFVNSPLFNATAAPQNVFKTSVTEYTSAAVGSSQQQQSKCRRKAVITVDAMTTEILIASDSVCRLFGLRDRSLIGKRLAQVFTIKRNGAHVRRLTNGAEVCETGAQNGDFSIQMSSPNAPIILGSEFLFDEATRMLKPVYGKAVDILDVNRKRTTICIWSYPLTPVTRTQKQTQRKTSAMIIRSPSVVAGFGAALTGDLSESRLSVLETTNYHNHSGVPNSAVQEKAQLKNALFNLKSNNNDISYSNFLHQQKQLQSQSESQTQQLQQQKQQKTQQEQQTEKPVKFAALNVLHEEHRSIDDYKKDSGEEFEKNFCDHNRANSHDPQKGSSCCASASTCSTAPEKRSLYGSSQQQQQQQHTKKDIIEEYLQKNEMVESRLYQQPQQKQKQRPIDSKHNGEANYICSYKDHNASNDDETLEKRAANRIIIKNGFKRTTVRLPEAQTVPVIIKGDLNENKSSSNDDDNKKEAQKFLLKQNDVVLQKSATSEMINFSAVNTNAAEEKNVFDDANSAVVSNTKADYKKQQLKHYQLQPQQQVHNYHKDGVGAALIKNSESTISAGGGSAAEAVMMNDESPLNRRWLLLMEPINALHIAVLLGAKGRIFRVDDPLASILGYESTNRLFGTEISRLIPSLKIGAEWDGVTQFCCGKTTRFNGIPFSAILQCDFDNDCNAYSYDLRIRSISSINGVVTITDSGMLYSYNYNFLQELLGHEFQIGGELDIKDLIPDFYVYLAAFKQEQQQHLQQHINEEAEKESILNTKAKYNAFALNFEDDNDSAREESELEMSDDDERQQKRHEQLLSHKNRSKAKLNNKNNNNGLCNGLQPKALSHERHRSSSSGCSEEPSTSNGIWPTGSEKHDRISDIRQQQQVKSKRLNNNNNINSNNNLNANSASVSSSANNIAASNNSSTNNMSKMGGVEEIIPGVYYGFVKHADKSFIPVKIEVSEVSMPSQPRMFNVGIGFDRSNDYGINQLPITTASESSLQMASDEDATIKKSITELPPPLSQLHKNKHHAYLSAIASTSQLPDSNNSTPSKPPLNSSLSVESGGVKSAKFSIGAGFGTLRECDSDSNIDILCPKSDSGLELSADSRLHDVSLHALENENNDSVRGEYSKYYDTFQLIGNGAFGSVKLAARKNTGYLAVAKFVCKSKVLPESWVQSPKRGNRMVPIEVHLLENLQHANIVKVLDVFENDKYYQLVMEKLGYGMDLFEFIEFQPRLDEPLTSFIFRQIVSAVDYLHENHIVHRDLKDENVIVDQHFCCKLIDFGSAAYFGENIVFSTFCGTMEYCSPEVLTGNKYLGPELEMWSLGILLYTLVFFENPFRNPQETVQAEFEIPWEISEGLYQVLNWLLLPDPRRRATVGEIKRHWWVTQRVDPNKFSFQDSIRNCEQAQLMSPKYVSQLSAHNSVGNLSGLTIGALSNNSSSGEPPNPDEAATTTGETTNDTDERKHSYNNESSTATSTVGTDSSLSSTATPLTIGSPLFTLNSIDSDPAMVDTVH